MSRYSGKCDIYDTFENGDDTFDTDKIRRTEFFQNGEKLNINTERQLALYFPFIVASMFHVKNDKCVCNISSMSYMRRSEIENIEFYLDQIRKEKRMCKLRGEEPTPERIIERRFSWISNGKTKESIISLIEKSSGKGRKKYDDVRLDIYDYTRQRWYNDLISKYNYPREFAYDWVMNK